jgi:transcriptional regulator with XRE-family HTH domain
MVDEFYERLGGRLRTRRKGAGISQETLARRLRLSRTTYVNIEKGRQRLATHQLVEIADALGCEASDLLPPRHASDLPAELAGQVPDAGSAAFVSSIRSRRKDVP